MPQVNESKLFQQLYDDEIELLLHAEDYEEVERVAEIIVNKKHKRKAKPRKLSIIGNNAIGLPLGLLLSLVLWFVVPVTPWLAILLVANSACAFMGLCGFLLDVTDPSRNPHAKLYIGLTWHWLIIALFMMWSGITVPLYGVYHLILGVWNSIQDQMFE